MKQSEILTSEQKARLSELRSRENTLTSNEAAELRRLLQVIEDAEMVYFGPANDKLRQEREVLQAHNAQLRQLIERKKAVVARLKKAMEEAQTERQAIDEEITKIFPIQRTQEKPR